MEQVIIRKKDGSLLRLFNYGKVGGVTRAEQVKEFMGQDVVNLTVQSAEPVTFDSGDYLEAFGERYTLNLVPQETKTHDRLFEYNARFEGSQYELIKVQYIDVDAAGFSTGASFSLMGDLEDFVRMIIRNLDRVYGVGTWTLGDHPGGTESKLLTFTNETCLQALQNICQEYETNFVIERTGPATYKLHIRKVENELPDTFRYGRCRGLYTLERSGVNNKSIITRLYAFGGMQNLPDNYRNGSPRLKMPIGQIHSEGQPYIQDDAAVQKYGVVEGSATFDDIYPHRVGVVSAINGADKNVFYDANMPFNLNDQLLPGISAKVNFKSGNLAGYTLEVASYDHNTNEFELIPFTDERGQDFPSSNTTAFRIQTGDKYVLIDIKMPAAYVTQAENKLLEKAQEHLHFYSRPAVQWSLEVDPNYLESKETVPGEIINYFEVGHYLNVVDPDLRIDGKSQILSFTRDLLDHYRYSVTLGEQYTPPFESLRVRIQRIAARTSVSSYSINPTFQLITNNIINQPGGGGIPGGGGDPGGGTPDPDFSGYQIIYASSVPLIWEREALYLIQPPGATTFDIYATDYYGHVYPLSMPAVNGPFPAMTNGVGQGQIVDERLVGMDVGYIAWQGGNVFPDQFTHIGDTISFTGWTTIKNSPVVVHPV